MERPSSDQQARFQNAIKANSFVENKFDNGADKMLMDELRGSSSVMPGQTKAIKGAHMA